MDPEKANQLLRILQKGVRSKFGGTPEEIRRMSRYTEMAAHYVNRRPASHSTRDYPEPVPDDQRCSTHATLSGNESTPATQSSLSGSQCPQPSNRGLADHEQSDSEGGGSSQILVAAGKSSGISHTSSNGTEFFDAQPQFLTGSFPELSTPNALNSFDVEKEENELEDHETPDDHDYYVIPTPVLSRSPTMASSTCDVCGSSEGIRSLSLPGQWWDDVDLLGRDRSFCAEHAPIMEDLLGILNLEEDIGSNDQLDALDEDLVPDLGIQLWPANADAFD